MNSNPSASSMDTKTFYETLEESFDLLNPYQKAQFIDARLAWSSNGALCAELTQRLCTSVTIDENEHS